MITVKNALNYLLRPLKGSSNNKTVSYDRPKLLENCKTTYFRRTDPTDSSFMAGE